VDKYSNISFLTPNSEQLIIQFRYQQFLVMKSKNYDMKTCWR